MQWIIQNKFASKLVIQSLKKSFWFIFVIFFTKKNFKSKVLLCPAPLKMKNPPPWKWKHSLPFLSFWILTRRSYLTHRSPCTFTSKLKDIRHILSFRISISKKVWTKKSFDNFPLFVRPRGLPFFLFAFFHRPMPERELNRWSSLSSELSKVGFDILALWNY